jgi:signal transduction histidine kinase
MGFGLSDIGGIRVAGGGGAARATVAFCALLVLGASAAAFHLTRKDREETVEQVRNENGFIASAFEEHARRILRTADTTLRFLQHEVEEGRGVTEELREFGVMTREDLSAVQIAISDARGDLLYSVVPTKGPINIADREHFEVHRASPDVGLYVAKPVVTKATMTWSFFLSRRWNRPDGSFGGIVSVGLDPFYFGKVYGNLRIGQDRVGMLVGTDHVVRVRVSRDESFVGDDISGYSPVFREAARSPVGSYEVVTARIQRARFASYRAMPDFPLIVIVSAVQDDVLAAWRSRAFGTAAGAVVFSAFVAGFGWLLLRAQALTRRREREAHVLQERLVQAQKLESIGTLAGGVAHDFNNMLGVILGQVEFAMEEAGASGPLRESLEEIRQAAHRSANVTRQLLAFARKQAIAPRVLDLNEGVETILRMIRRLIGERIELRWDPGHPLWKVKIDPSQLDQLLTNLAANARDAIPGDGTVTIATANETLAADACAARPGATPGDYAVLSVQDTGAGIDREKLPSIFEPFFTTKETGKGTGLGLATVYGIVKQNGGFIDVETAPGAGSTFRIYLPRAAERDASETAPQGEAAPTRGQGETVLLVEDEQANLALVKKMVESIGYRVLATHDPLEALRLAAAAPEIHLLLTDVVMPRMDGKELHETLRRSRPGVKCLYMSGYPANVIVHQGVLDPGLSYLQKPFTRTALGEKIRQTLQS